MHLARTVARRAERSGWALYAADPERTNRDALLYLNRLSDLLFILARTANPGGDVMWQPGGADQLTRAGIVRLANCLPSERFAG